MGGSPFGWKEGDEGGGGVGERIGSENGVVGRELDDDGEGVVGGRGKEGG